MAKINNLEVTGNVSFTTVSQSVTLAGRAGVLTTGPHICIESWRDSTGTHGYRLYDDGYLEQWGFCNPKTVATTTVNLFYNYCNTGYIVVIGESWTGGHTENVSNSNKTVSSFQLLSGTGSTFGVYWRTIGYAKL